MTTTIEEKQTASAGADSSPRCAQATGSGIERARDAARAWCKQNPGWEPICDMGSTDHLYFGWNDLTKSQKLSWRYRHGEEAKAIFEYQTRPCKVANGWIDEAGNFSDDIPFGVVGMMVFKSQNQ